MLKGKTVVLGVTGSIAAYKIASLASALVKLHADVNVIMTKNATNFINPITFESLTGTKCLVDTFDRNFEFQVEHVSLAQKADIFMVAPASANVIGKIANGIADDMLTTTIMAAKCPKYISPAMNTNMFENPIVQDNISKLKNYGYEVIDLGKDVPIEEVVNHSKKNNIQLVGLSALMTTTVHSMKETIDALRKEGLNTKIFVGGAVLTEEYAKDIGADYYSKDAKSAVEIAKLNFN